MATRNTRIPSQVVELSTPDLPSESSSLVEQVAPLSTSSAVRFSPEPASESPSAGQGWGARRAKVNLPEKQAMAKYCIEHDFLVRKSPAEHRDTVASILVNQGTTPNEVVQEALRWIKKNWREGPFDITWYATGGLVSASLHDFRDKNPALTIAAQVFLFPGRVNFDLQSVAGPEAEEFVEQLDNDFTYAFLSAYAFDIDLGGIHFLYSEELRLQRACARLYADHKFLFLDRSKIKREGKRGYGLAELLEKGNTVTIYTTGSKENADDNKLLEERFLLLCNQLFLPAGEAPAAPAITKTIRLRIVDTNSTLLASAQRAGLLRPSPHK